MNEGKLILDVCCGPRCFWFNKHREDTIYMDNRREPKGFIDNRENRFIEPDILADFRAIPFPDNSFKLVIMDPPHIISKNNSCRMTKIYGCLNKDTWKEDIGKGFREAWRVLEPYGILIFKWSECSVKRKELLEIIGKEPLIGHPNGSKIPTHWFCFMKIPNIELKGGTNTKTNGN